MVSVQKVKKNMLYDVFSLFHNMKINIDETKCMNLFQHEWTDEDYCGYALFDSFKIVGFLGMIFSKRTINNKTERFCNLTTWIVREEYRDQSLSLLLPITKLKNYTLTDLSPSRKVYIIQKKLGFQDLDKKMRILLPILCNSRKITRESLSFAENGDVLRNRLKDDDLKLYNDHLCYSSKFLLAHGRGDYCFIIYTMIKIRFIPICYIQYISNVKMFCENHHAIRNNMAKMSKIPIAIVDSRLIRDTKVERSFDFPLASYKLYKSPNLRPYDIDNLYSELILFNIGTLPGLRTLWWDLRQAGYNLSGRK
jgi:hypothetical protein